MNTATNNSLTTLIRLSRERVEQAGGQLHRSVAEQQSAQEQLATLKTYHADYTERLQSAQATGITASNYHNFTRFLATLDEAIMHQTRVVAHLDHIVTTNKEHWRDAQRRLHAYETLQTRKRQQHLAIENRREQRMNDELSSAIHRRSLPQRAL